MRRFYALAASLLLFATACGKDSTDPGDNGNLVNGSFSGSVNGAAFVPLAVTVVSNSGFTVVSSADAQGRSLAFGVFATGAGAVTIAQTPGNNALYFEGSLHWVAGTGVGGSGTITFTTLTANRAAGSFNLSLVAESGSGATGTRTATGNFDITF